MVHDVETVTGEGELYIPVVTTGGANGGIPYGHTFPAQ